MSPFFRFPHTPHLAWLGQGSPRDDKVLSPSDADETLNEEVVVEEKIDGANIGFSVETSGIFRMQNRGQYLEPPFSGQFARLASWLVPHRESLVAALGQNLILFGEWCAARHSLGYDKLPDWFLAFDVYDREAQRFWSTRRRNDFVAQLGISAVPAVLEGRTTLASLKQLLTTEATPHGDGPMEGIVVRQEDDDWLKERAKLVRADFTQAITEHWSRRKIEWNKVIPTSERQGAGAAMVDRLGK